MQTILLLVTANPFTTTAWYGQLRTASGALPLLAIILISWLLALPEDALAVPAGRLRATCLGGTFPAWQLTLLQEGAALAASSVFALCCLRGLPRWQDLTGLAPILAGLALAWWRRGLPAA